MREYNIYAVDFDGTLCDNCYPEIGEANYNTVDLIKSLKEQGHKIILWTCRTGERLEKAVKWCKKQGIIFDAINENLPEIVEAFGGDTRKIVADAYIDDKAWIPPARRTL